MSCVSTRQMSWLSTRHMSCVSTLRYAQCSEPTQRKPQRGAAEGRPPLWRRPEAASSIWVSPWVRVRVFGTPGQVLHIFMTATMCRFAYGFPHGPGHAPPWDWACSIELPLGTVSCFATGRGSAYQLGPDISKAHKLTLGGLSEILCIF